MEMVCHRGMPLHTCRRLVPALLLILFSPTSEADMDVLTPEVVYQWNTIGYDWPNDTIKNQYLENGNYVPQKSAITGIKVFRGRVYVTVPRLKGGVPSTLNVIVENRVEKEMSSATHVLRPFPSWEMQKFGDCSALQVVQSMEIDPNTGLMWVVDTGYVPENEDVAVRPLDACPGKLVMYDLETGTEVYRYEFPRNTVGYGVFYMNDIVLQYDNGTARWAYISDSLDYKLVVYDHLEKRSYYYSHPNMKADRHYRNITISNITITDVISGINGMAMSPDFRFLYYSPVAGVGLYQIPTEVLTFAQGSSSAFAATVRTVGKKITPGDGMVYGAKNNLYYSSLGENAIYKWDVKTDMKPNGIEHVTLVSQSKLATDPRMEWIDALALDENGYLWFTTNRLRKIFSDPDVSEAEANFFVWRVHVNDYHYLNHSWSDRTTKSPTQRAVSPSLSFFTLIFCIVYSLIL